MKVGSGVSVEVGAARAVCVYSIATVAATWVKTALISRVGAVASAEPQALKMSIKATLMRSNGEESL
jgi:hypothetical protein